MKHTDKLMEARSTYAHAINKVQLVNGEIKALETKREALMLHPIYDLVEDIQENYIKALKESHEQGIANVGDMVTFADTKCFGIFKVGYCYQVMEVTTCPITEKIGYKFDARTLLNERELAKMAMVNSQTVDAYIKDLNARSFCYDADRFVLGVTVQAEVFY